MADFHIYIGYRTVSSWSLRGWLPMKKTGVPFEETLIRYRTPEGKAALNQLSPTGKVPLLVHQRDGARDQGLGFARHRRIPRRDRSRSAAVAGRTRSPRAYARSISAEMHSGFRALREHLSMALLERHPDPDNPQANADIARVEEIWRECRERWGKTAAGRSCSAAGRSPTPCMRRS